MLEKKASSIIPIHLTKGKKKKKKDPPSHIKYWVFEKMA
jgi:hypothetical protein